MPKNINKHGEEIHTLIQFAIKSMNNTKVEKKRKTENELNHFEQYTFSVSENNSWKSGLENSQTVYQMQFFLN